MTSTPPATDTPRRRTRPLTFVLTIVLALLLVYVVHTWIVRGEDRAETSRIQAWLVVAAAVAAAWKPLRRFVAARVERIRHPFPRYRLIAAVIIGVAASAYLLSTAAYQGRKLVPKYHDDHMYLLQMQHLAHGRLWYPAHPVAESFESFYILHEPVYASVYFPGTALLYAPTVWLGLPFWVGPLAVAGAVAGLFYSLVTELIDGCAGALAALMLVGTSHFRNVSLVPYSHLVIVLQGLILVWLVLRWRDRGMGLAYAASIGAVAGWAAITRPVDAMIWATPVGIAMLVKLGRDARPRKFLASVAVVVAAATPFLSLQVIFNYGVTGNPLKTPYHLYQELYAPGMGYGFKPFDPAARPKSSLHQKHVYHDQFTAPAMQEHTPRRRLETFLSDRVLETVRLALPTPYLISLAPAALLLVGARWRWVIAAVVPLHFAFYALFPFLLAHYTVSVAPALQFCIVLGGVALPQAYPQARAALVTFVTLALCLLMLSELPEFNAGVRDHPSSMRLMVFNYQGLPAQVEKPALVLFKFDPGSGVHEEPVYNIDVPSPDDAPIIRAHDLGPEQNLKLLRYYAERQPNRHVYFFDRLRAHLVSVGTAGELWAQLRATPTTTAPTTQPATVTAR